MHQIFVLLVIVGTCLVAASPLENANLRIIGGTDVKKGTYPFIVALRSLDGHHHCGGSIITNRWVLTAAHCLYRYTIEDMLVHAATNSRLEKGDVYKPEKLIWNQYFSFEGIGNDTGLLKVNRDFDFSNPLIQPVVLNYKYVEGGEALVAIGFGRSEAPQKNILQQLNMETVSHLKCRIWQYADETELCVYNSKNSGVCSGDSGSPIVLKGSNTQVGIASRVKKCASGYYDLYTRVSYYEKWIKDNIKNN